MADIYHWHWRRGPRPKDGSTERWATARALAGGLVAIALLTALLAGLAGGALYAAVLLLTKAFS